MKQPKLNQGCNMLQQIAQCVGKDVLILTTGGHQPYGTVVAVNTTGHYLILETGLYCEAYIRTDEVVGLFTRPQRDEEDEETSNTSR